MERPSLKTLLWIAIIGVVLFFLFGGRKYNGGYWNLNIPYPAGVTTNPADVLPGTNGRPPDGSGYPLGTYVGNAAGFYGGN